MKPLRPDPENKVQITHTDWTRADNTAYHAEFEKALSNWQESLGKYYPMFINGRPHEVSTVLPIRSPANTNLILGYSYQATATDASHAVDAAKRAFPAWRATPYQQRIAYLRRAADLIEEERFRIAALISLEVGKNRFESMSEVEEGLALIRYYCDDMEQHDGYCHVFAEDPKETSHSVLRPYGVWAIISPFNYPFALACGMSAAALVTGNTVVQKPTEEAPLSSLQLCNALMKAGLPDGVFNVVTGTGEEVGRALVENPRIDGVGFTGSMEVGLSIYRNLGQPYPKPCISEMGGKNAAIVMESADLETAAEGVVRSAFRFAGQKCSACSRVYVHRIVKSDFLDHLVQNVSYYTVGQPWRRGVMLGPVISEKAQERFRRAVELARRDGRVIYGGEIPQGEEYDNGYFVTPTIVEGLPQDHELVQNELFLPFLSVLEVDSLEQAIQLANDVPYGLTAGIYTLARNEIDFFLENIEAGVVYVNRAVGATTGAWIGKQSFGGWKGSGSTGKNAHGPYYLPQFMREQCRTLANLDMLSGK